MLVEAETRVAPVPSLDGWPAATLIDETALDLAGLPQTRIVNRTSVLVIPEIPLDLVQTLKQFELGDTAASLIGGGSAIACSDFRFTRTMGTRVLLLNKDLNAYRLGRMVRRLYEIEAYRSMALLSLSSARALAPMLDGYDAQLVTLTNKNLITQPDGHKALLDEISKLSAHVICASAESRNRFAASAAYSKIVEERILELRESHVSGFQRYGIFIVRRFRPAMRSCEAAAARLERLSHATMHLLDLLQTRIQGKPTVRAVLRG